MQDNPYLAPAAEVSDPITEQRADGTFLGTPQSRPAGAAVAWIGHSWRLFKASPGMWIALTLVLMGGTIALQAIPLIGGLLPGLLYPLLSAGLMFGSTIDGGFSLTTVDAAVTQFSGEIGGTTPLILFVRARPGVLVSSRPIA